MVHIDSDTVTLIVTLSVTLIVTLSVTLIVSVMCFMLCIRYVYWLILKVTSRSIKYIKPVNYQCNIVKC